MEDQNLRMNRPNLKKNTKIKIKTKAKAKRAGDLAQVVECLSRKYKVLGSNSSVVKRKATVLKCSP
jgi:hypothetical protein